DPPDTGDELAPDLVAFLDGELEAPAMEAIEAKISLDAVVRAEADALKKTWDLLDHLPRSEPSVTFTERTVSRIEPLRPAIDTHVNNGAPASRGVSGSPQRASTVTTPAFAIPATHSPRRRLLLLSIGVVGLTLAAFAGYYGRDRVVALIERIDRQDKR